MIILISRINSEVSFEIMSVNYSTQGLKDTSHLKTVRLIGSIKNYGHKILNSKNNSLIIINITSKGIRNSILRTCRHYFSQ